MDENIKEKIKAIDDEIAKLEDKLYQLRGDRCVLERENSGYFIVNCYDGDGDYWDEYLTIMGLTTEEEAKKKAIELNGDIFADDDYWPGTLPPYFEVSKEQYQLYVDWARLKEAWRAVPNKFGDLEIAISNQIKAVMSKIENEKIRNYGDSFIHINKYR